MAPAFPWLKEKLAAYTPPLHTYEVTYKLVSQQLLEQPGCLLRTSFTPGHFTASVWAINSARTHCLLLKHQTLGHWLQPGGHADGEENLLNVALRELEEETGYTRDMLTLPLGDAIFHLDVHGIPERVRNGITEPLHLHYDARFLVEIDHTLPIPGSAENQQVRWLSNEEAEAHFPINHGRWTMLHLAQKI
jgi:8-oxo-dGTP pyrophosphatase MutT (NUDIX family)